MIFRKLLLNAKEVYYRRLRVWLGFNPRKGTCEACGKLLRTNRHHWIYKYPTAQVRAKPILALDYTTELCAGPNPQCCHKLGDSIRNITEAMRKNPEKVRKLFRFARGDMGEDFDTLWMKALKEARK